MKRYSVVQRHKSRGIKTWYGRIHDLDTGSVRYVSLSVDKKKDALLWRDRMISEQLSGESRKDSSVAIEDAVGAWKSSCDLNERTLLNYGSAMKRLVPWMSVNGVRTVGDLTPLAASKFVASLDDWSPSTKRKRLSIYRTWAGWVMEMYDTGWKKNPFVTVRVKGARPKPKDFWTLEQVEAIIAAQPNPKVALMYAFMAFAGLRYGEFRSLRLSDIVDEEGIVKKRLRICGKGGKEAFVPICTRLREQIISTYQLPKNQTHPQKPKGKFLAILGAAKGLNIPIHTSNNTSQNNALKDLIHKNSILASFGGKVHLHRFRHSFISNLIRANCCSVRCVAELARHENVMITLNTYAHLLPSDKEEALEIFTNHKKKGGSK